MDGKIRTLELTVLSLQELHVDWKHATESLYVVVRAESITSYATDTATDDGGNPTWNEKLVMDLSVHARSITLVVKCKNNSGMRDVGIARIAVSDFLGGAVPEQCLQFFNYRLRDWEGRHGGIINFSVRVRAPEKPCSSSGYVAIGIPIWWNNPIVRSLMNPPTPKSHP